MDLERDITYEKYHQSVNMSYSELKNWSENPCSKKASLNRSPIKRNLYLLSIPKSEWGRKEITWAKKTISFIARHKGQPEGKNISKDCPYSKRFIALANWAYWS